MRARTKILERFLPSKRKSGWKKMKKPGKSPQIEGNTSVPQQRFPKRNRLSSVIFNFVQKMFSLIIVYLSWSQLQHWHPQHRLKIRRKMDSKKPEINMFPIWLISDVFGYNFCRKVKISLNILEKCLPGCLKVFLRSSVSSDVSLNLWKTLHYEINFCCFCDEIAIEQGRLMSLAQTSHFWLQEDKNKRKNESFEVRFLIQFAKSAVKFKQIGRSAFYEWKYPTSESPQFFEFSAEETCRRLRMYQITTMFSLNYVSVF